jgi:DNA mismatch repair protein MutS2
MDSHALHVLEFEEVRRMLESYASSPLARSVIRTIRPSTDPARLALSLRQLDEARALMDVGRDLPVGGLRDMMAVVRDAHRQNRAMGPEELVIVRHVILVTRGLRGFFRENVQRAPTLAELAEKLLDHGALLEEIERVVEPPGEVADRASPRLWELRRRRQDLEDRIRESMDELVAAKRYRPFLQERTWSLRNGRYVLMVRMESRGNVRGILHDKSASGETVFVEPNEVVALTNDLADVRLDEDRECTRLLLELSQKVYGEERRLAYTQNVAAWIDFTAARARMSADLGLRAARLVDRPVIRLKDARHPLLVKSRREGHLTHEVVSCTLTLGDPFGMVVVTGPNTGGKTVTLKTVGLIQIMFQSGLHVPVGLGTELPCLDGIHADIGDEQSLAQNLSTFSGHVANIVDILRVAGPKSLVLLDELGAGTDPEEGAALGEAILEKLHDLGALTVVTTHLGSLKAYAFSRPDVENACMAFDQESLEPTYEFVVGQPGSSQALRIAARHGMPEDIIRRARGTVGTQPERSAELMEELMVSRMAAERSRQESAALVEESRGKRERAETALREAEAARSRIEGEAESEVARLMTEIVDDARPHLNALKNVPKNLTEHVAALEGLFSRRRHVGSFAERRREFLSGLKKYDEVYVPRFGQICRIEKLQRATERLTVKVGGISMQIAFDDVSWVTPPDAGR